MGKAKPPLLEYNSKNLRRVVKSIWRNLRPDLLPKKFHQKNLDNPVFGHCHNASGCLYKIFGSQNLHLFKAEDKNGIYHWWVQDKNNFIIDLTWSQYLKKDVIKLYKNGHKASLLGFEYKKRVQALFEGVKDELKF